MEIVGRIEDDEVCRIQEKCYYLSVKGSKRESFSRKQVNEVI